MARPTKCRRVCCFPEVSTFIPDGENAGQPIVLAVDEYEVIRLIDYEGLSQEDCAAQLGVGRTTVQSIYENARKKIAEALVGGRPIKIDGGNFFLCNGNTEQCYKKECVKRKLHTQNKIEKGENSMKIAVTYENGEVYQHFGRTEQFKVYDVENGAIVKSEIVGTNGSGHGALAGVLAALHADVLICGGIGGGAQTALRESGIEFYGGVRGNADDAVKAFVAGELAFDPNVHCDHHEKEHGGTGHTCGAHGCGHGHCGEH